MSRAGFEVTIVDHTGLDVVAYQPPSKKRLGITVKARTRHPGSESTSVTIFKYGKHSDDRRKLLDGCEAFGCEPWVAVYVETEQAADLYLTHLDNYDGKYRVAEPGLQDTWKMGKRLTATYPQDEDIRHVSFSFGASKWSWKSLGRSTNITTTDEASPTSEVGSARPDSTTADPPAPGTFSA